MLTRLILALGLLAWAVTAAHAQPADATAALADSSALVVTGRVATVAMADEGSGIYTYVTLEVQDVLKGRVPSPAIVIKQLGGAAGNVALHIAGQARFTAGDDVLVFLAVRPRDGTLYTVGLSSGVWRLARSLQSGQLMAAQGGQIIDVADVQSIVLRSVPHDDPFVAHPPELRTRALGDSVSASYTFVPEGPARWHEADQGVRIPVDYATVPGGLPGEPLSALDAAITAWNGVGTTLGLDRAQTGPAQCPASSFTGNGRIAFYWNDPCGEISDSDASTFGVGGGYFTSGHVKTINGVDFQQFVQGLAILNNTGPHLTTDACLRDAIMHVIGHAVGLGDSGDAAAVMFPTLRAGCSSGASGLGSDDVAGLRAIYPQIAAANQPPNAPTAMTASVTLNTVVLSWTPASTGGPADTYIIEAGSAPNLANLAVMPVQAPATSLTVTAVPSGVYYVRVRARNVLGTSPPSPEVVVTVGPCSVPGTPMGLTYTADGNLVSINWTAPTSGGVQGYILSAGFGPGQSNAAVVQLGPVTSFSAMAPFGDYYVRVQAVNACGAGTPSSELLVSLRPCTAAPAAPANLTFTKSGNVVTLQWNAPASGPAPARYRIVAGSAPGTVDLAVIDTSGNATTIMAAAPDGVYYVRVQSVNDCGASAFSNEVVITVREAS